MFSFDCRSRNERSLRLLQTRSRLQSGTGKEVGRKVTGHCLVCRWSASRCLVNGSPLADCTHCRHWNTVFKPAVDVAPRHHKCSSSQQDPVRLTRPTFRYISGKVPSSVPRALSSGAEVTSAAATDEETARRRKDPLALLSSQSEPRGKEFRVRFSKLNSLRERTTLARDTRNIFHTFPYANPKPHDHRLVSPAIWSAPLLVLSNTAVTVCVLQCRFSIVAPVSLSLCWSSIPVALCHSATGQDTEHTRPTAD